MHTVRGLATRTYYERHQAGDIFMIWEEDLQAQPDVFTPVAMPTTQTSTTLDPAAPERVRP